MRAHINTARAALRMALQLAELIEDDGTYAVDRGPYQQRQWVSRWLRGQVALALTSTDDLDALVAWLDTFDDPPGRLTHGCGTRESVRQWVKVRRGEATWDDFIHTVDVSKGRG